MHATPKLIEIDVIGKVLPLVGVGFSQEPELGSGPRVAVKYPWLRDTED